MESKEGKCEGKLGEKRPAASSADVACAQNDDVDDDVDDDDTDSAAMRSVDMMSARTRGGSASSMQMQSSSVLRASPLSLELQMHCRTTWHAKCKA